MGQVGAWHFVWSESFGRDSAATANISVLFRGHLLTALLASILGMTGNLSRYGQITMVFPKIRDGRSTNNATNSFYRIRNKNGPSFPDSLRCSITLRTRWVRRSEN